MSSPSTNTPFAEHGSTEDFATERGTPDPVAPAARRVIEQVRDEAMFLLDRRGRVASWNEGVWRILGWSEADWIGQPLSVVFTEEDVHRGVHERDMRRAARQGHAAGDRWLRRRSGERFLAHAALTSLRDDEGRPAGYLEVLRDVTAGRHAQELRQRQLQERGHELELAQSALHERTAEWRVLVEGVRDYAIFTMDTEGRIDSWHVGAQRMKGYTAQEAIGMRFADLFTPEDRAGGRPEHEMDVAARTGEYQGEGRRVRKDGSLFEAAVVLTALRGPDGDLLGFLKLTQDITRRKQAEAERDAMLREAQAAREEAERSSHTQGEFLATISHELRTPLSAILGWAHVLERGSFDPATVQHGLSAISRNARTQVQLIEDLLDVNRIESGQLRLDLQRIELGGVIAAAIDSALPSATAKGIGLSTVFGPDPGVVMGDAGRLQQVVGNLLNNAIKFTPPGGQVRVTLTQSQAGARIDISDTGQGIEAGFVDQVFDRFHQQDASITRRHGGLGLGLAIVRHLVQLHGGTVSAHSAGPGLGATFTIVLPLSLRAVGPRPGPSWPGPAAASAGDTDASPPPRLDGVSVLLVDDEPDVRSIAARVLQEAGAQVFEAANAGEGLDLLRREKPAVILSDIGMPLVDGYDMMRRVRDLPPAEGGRIPAAAFTAYTRPEDRQRAYDAGFQMHLGKPVSPATLVQAVSVLARGGDGGAVS